MAVRIEAQVKQVLHQKELRNLSRWSKDRNAPPLKGKFFLFIFKYLSSTVSETKRSRNNFKGHFETF